MTATSRGAEPILIAGGGIGGLSAAIALAATGEEVRLFEKSAKPTVEGAGIQLGPNATRLLRDWGVLDELRTTAVRAEGIGIGDGITGEPLATVPLGDLAEARYGAPYLLVHRADLQRALLARARSQKGLHIAFGREVTGFDQSPEGVVADTSKGAARGRAMIVADGLWSTLRNKVDKTAHLSFTERTAWRALVDPEVLPQELRGAWTGLWMARNAHLVHYPVQAGRAVNVVAVIHDRWSAREGWGEDAEAEVVLSHFRRWDDRLQTILKAAKRWRKWSLYDLPPLRRWTLGMVALLGDAAHPILPFLAQGGALAIEDAAFLAHTLARADGDIWEAFPEYEDKRIWRSARIRYESRRMGDIYHMSGLSRRVRDFVLRRRAPESLLRRFDWLYGFDALAS